MANDQYRRIKNMEGTTRNYLRMRRTASMDENAQAHANRVKKRLDNAALNMQVSRQLEERELALLERVKNTYNTEKKMVESLR